MRLSRAARRGIAQFNAVKFSPVRAMYTVSYKTVADSLAKVYEDLKAEAIPNVATPKSISELAGI